MTLFVILNLRIFYSRSLATSERQKKDLREPNHHEIDQEFTATARFSGLTGP